MIGISRNIRGLACLLALVVLPAAATERLRLATTTSTENSGLLARLHPAFEQAQDVAVDVIAVGSGKALALGRNGDVDVILAHDPVAEEAFMADGAGSERHPVMHNDFVILGPSADPAKVGAATSAADAFARIASARSAFVSRGDQSGTHTKELALWQAAAVTPAGPWYLSVGQGMEAALQIATDKGAYILADRGTWLAYKRQLELRLLHAGDPALFNPYHVLLVNPALHPHVKAALAKAYADFLTSADGRRRIAEFMIEGEQLFVPDP